MPYIKQEKRKVYNPYIKLIETDCFVEGALSKLIERLQSESIEDKEGSLNYIITQLIRNRELIDESIVLSIETLLERIYTYAPRYFKFKDVFGLLDTIAKELLRREWDTPTNIAFLASLDDKLFELYAEYEDEAIKKSGDLENI